jgi:hypothetical protein
MRPKIKKIKNYEALFFTNSMLKVEIKKNLNSWGRDNSIKNKLKKLSWNSLPNQPNIEWKNLKYIYSIKKDPKNKLSQLVKLTTRVMKSK